MFPYATKYKCWNITAVSGSDFAANEIDIGADLQAKYGTDRRIPSFSGFIVASSAVEVKFNSVDEDTIDFDTDLMGKVWTFVRDDMLVDKLFFANPATSPAVDVEIQVWATGSPEIHF